MTSPTRSISVVYDGECPFCSNYVHMLRLRELGDRVELINAREDHPLVDELKAAGFDLNEGMVVKIDDTISHGDAAIQQLALLTGPSTTFNRLNYWVFRSPLRSKILYPFLRTGRNLTLRLLGRSLIGNDEKPSSV